MTYYSEKLITDPVIAKITEVIESMVAATLLDMSVCPKKKIASEFYENKVAKDGITPMPKKEYYAQPVIPNLSYSAMPPMKKKFIRETVRIVREPVLKTFANNNISGTGDGMLTVHKNFTATQKETATRQEAVIKPLGNVSYMEDWRGKLRQSA